MKKKHCLTKMSLVILLIVFIVLVSASPCFAYGQTASTSSSGTHLWSIPIEGPPFFTFIGSEYAVSARANYMIAGDYIGFHEMNNFGRIYDTAYPEEFTLKVYAGISMSFYKNSSLLYSYSLTFDPDVWVSPSWVWDNHSGTAQGSVTQGSGTYTSKVQTSFELEQALFPFRNVYSTISFPSP